MSNILQFKRKPSDRFKGKTLCRNNHHKWKVLKEPRFDVKAGRLVTVEICERCEKRRHRLT